MHDWLVAESTTPSSKLLRIRRLLAPSHGIRRRPDDVCTRYDYRVSGCPCPSNRPRGDQSPATSGLCESSSEPRYHSEIGMPARQ